MTVKIDKKHLVQIDRVCAWSLIAIMIIFFISGYGMTRGFIPEKLAKLIHDNLLPIPGGIAFAFHSAYGMHIGLKRWKVWGPIPRAILVTSGLAITAGVIAFAVSRGSGNSIQVPQSIDLG